MDLALYLLDKVFALMMGMAGAWFIYFLNTPKHHRLKIWEKSPSFNDYPSAWDYVFSNYTIPSCYGCKKKYWMKIRMKSGQIYGGIYAYDSYVSSFPDPEDILLEDAWDLTAGESYSEHPRRGLLLRRDELSAIEIYNLEEENENE